LQTKNPIGLVPWIVWAHLLIVQGILVLTFYSALWPFRYVFLGVLALNELMLLSSTGISIFSLSKVKKTLDNRSMFSMWGSDPSTFSRNTRELRIRLPLKYRILESIALLTLHFLILVQDWWSIWGLGNDFYGAIIRIEIPTFILAILFLVAF